jgi:alkanesulfonate monooxygenase SsuD/methylene tetrahydromethanopterin reductase-like flavin-dependent oxidoreductase (luciferase family)
LQSIPTPAKKGSHLFIGQFSEQPYQDRSRAWYSAADAGFTDLSLSNGEYDPHIGHELLARYLDETMFVEKMGFDGVMINEHHATPLTTHVSANMHAAILARITSRLKLVMLGNIIPLHEPLWLAEQLAHIDVLSGGRLVSGWVRGTGRESVAHNAPPTYNWERYQEAHDFIIRAWTDPGPFRWEGEHYQYRYVNPWIRPFQQPHPPIWTSGAFSRATVEWAVANRLPYVQVGAVLDLTRKTFDYYDELALKAGWEAGPQHRGYQLKIHVDETEAQAVRTARKLIEGPANIFIDGSRGARVSRHIQSLPGHTSRTATLPTANVSFFKRTRGLEAPTSAPAPVGRVEIQSETEREALFQRQLDELMIVAGTPDTVLPKIRHILETVRPGNIFFWSGDGDMTHEDTMRCLSLLGKEVIPEVRKMGDELGLTSFFEANERQPDAAAIA